MSPHCEQYRNTPKSLTRSFCLAYGDHRIAFRSAAAYVGHNSSSEACMTRAVVFLTATLAAASLGVFAQDTSGHQPARYAAAVSQAGSQSATTHSTAAPGGNSGAAASPAQASRSNPQTKPQAASSPTTSGAAQAIQTNADGKQLPQTSTILPLLGLIGLGSLVAGLFARR